MPVHSPFQFPGFVSRDMANAEVFDSFFRRADVDRDGLISGGEAVGFFQGSGLPQTTLAKIWQYSDSNRAGYLSRQEFFNALKLVTVAQTGMELTPELVKAALNGPAASKIPPPRIDAPTPPPSNANFGQIPRAPPGNYGRQFSSPGNFQATGSGVAQARPSLGGTSSLPSGAHGMHYSTGPGLSTGSGLQSTPSLGFPRPAPPSSMLSTAASLPSAPSFQAQGTGGLKVGQGSGDLYGMAITPTRPAGAGLPSQSKYTPDMQTSGGTDPMKPTALVPTTLSTSSSSTATPSAVPHGRDLGSAHRARPPSGPGASPPWPRMTSNDVLRYTRVFSRADTDRDGKIKGKQARTLFLSWDLPREVLKQVWNLSDEDGDSMLSIREFCTALYLMERFREGRLPPPVLPPGIHLDEPPGPGGHMPAAQRPVYSVPNWQQQGNMQQAGPVPAPVSSPAPIRPTLLTTPAGQMHLQNLTSSGSTVAEAPNDAFGEFNLLNKKKQPDSEAPSSRPAGPSPNTIRSGQDNFANKVTVDRKLMDHREKSAYYRTKLQEIVLFKSRCDNKISEISDRAAADKREVDSLAKKYDEKFKAAAEVNAQLTIENANVRDVQEKKIELLDALFKMEHGGDPNALLLKRASLIATDLDKLKIALRDRSRILGVVVKQKIPREMPFGWMQNLQERATGWDNWDELVDRDFSVVQDATDETTFTEKPSAAANWGKEEEGALVDENVPATDLNMNVGKDVSSTPEPVRTDVSLQNPSDAHVTNEIQVSASDLSTEPSFDSKSVLTSVPAIKVSERYANVRESHESGSELGNGSTAASSPTSSLELGRGSVTPDTFGGVRSPSGFDDDADSDLRASWGLPSNPPSTQASLDITKTRGPTRFRKSTGSLDLGSPRTSSIDGASSPARAFEPYRTNRSEDFDSSGTFGSLATSNDSKRISALFGGTASPSAAAATPSLFADSSRVSGSFMRFDAFGSGSPVAPPKPSGAVEDRPNNIFTRFDSFNSVQAGGAPSSGFPSDDELDVFSARGRFQAQASDGWKTF